MYELIKENDFNSVCYKENINAVYGIGDENYKKAYQYLEKLLNKYSLYKIRKIRLFSYFLEYGLDIAMNYPDISLKLWHWIKPELKHKKNVYGN